LQTELCIFESQKYSKIKSLNRFFELSYEDLESSIKLILERLESDSKSKKKSDENLDPQVYFVKSYISKLFEHFEEVDSFTKNIKCNKLNQNFLDKIKLIKVGCKTDKVIDSSIDLLKVILSHLKKIQYFHNQLGKSQSKRRE